MTSRISAFCQAFRYGHDLDRAAAAFVQSVPADLSASEAAELAHAIADSGEKVSLPADLSPFADCPSTGGPSSLSTLLCPLLLAADNITVPKLSATGSVAGAIDTFGLIKGFVTRLEKDQFMSALRSAQYAHSETTAAMCPADAALIRERRARKLMAHAGLAAASLLAKKLVVPGTAASYDFRVGPLGNIGADLETAQVSGALLLAAAGELGIPVATVFTDCRTFASTALGRFESLALLWSIVDNRTLLPLDSTHLDTCLLVAAHAVCLVTREVPAEVVARLRKRLRLGEVRRRLEDHLIAQGASLREMDSAISAGDARPKLLLRAQSYGHWTPPDLGEAVTWIKSCLRARTAAGYGLRLLASPGQEVVPGQPTIALAFPEGDELPLKAPMLGGCVSSVRPCPGPQVLGTML